MAITIAQAGQFNVSVKGAGQSTSFQFPSSDDAGTAIQAAQRAAQQVRGGGDQAQYDAAVRALGRNGGTEVG